MQYLLAMDEEEKLSSKCAVYLKQRQGNTDFFFSLQYSILQKNSFMSSFLQPLAAELVYMFIKTSYEQGYY